MKKNSVKVISAKENISEGPEGIILESMLEGMAEYYSAKLAVKVNRGMMENALKDGVFETQCETYRVVTVSNYQYNPSFYREMFRKAGAHIYTENGEVLCVANDLVMFHAK